jgi:hypothetical protein
MGTKSLSSVLQAIGASLTLMVCVFLSACGGGGGGGGGAPSTPAAPPTGPVIPSTPASTIPAELWRAPADALPKTGNYIYFSSEKGNPAPDFVGAGENYLYSAEKNSDMYVRFVDGRIDVLILNQLSNAVWVGDMRPADGATPMQAGYYGNAQRYPFQGTGRNALDFTNSGLQRGCNQLTGWFAVDRIEYVNGQPAVLDMRFEQHCEGNVPALHGQIHWVFDLTPPAPPGPIAPPAGLWRADASAIPAAGNYLHLESDLGNYIGDFFLQPTSRLYTDLDSVIDINPDNASLNRLLVRIRGDLKWEGDFQAKASLARLEVGYYGGLPGRPFSTERGGLAWQGDARSGGGGNSWFMVDRVVYEGDKLVEIDLRFAQRGLVGNNELRGQLHWRAADKLPAPGPVYPPPAGLWMPPAATLPTVGNYTYLQSDPGDFVGGSATFLYTSPRAQVSVDQRPWMPGGVEVRAGESDLWFGTFVPPENMSQLRPGYYAGLIGASVFNPAKGGLAWFGLGRGCNELKGWFVVDKVAYVADTIVALDLRFEQHCEGAVPALHGAIHWVR